MQSRFKNYKLLRKNFLLPVLLIFIFLFYWTRLNFVETGTVKIWDRNRTLLYESAGQVGKKIPVNLDRIPKNLINAAIASEDVTFWINPGIDPKAIIRSLYLNLKARKIVSGASTITQQLVRASIISPHKPVSRSIIRKIKEIFIAVRLTLTYSKRDILSFYFNRMYFGNLAYGIQAASSFYFAKDVSNLSLAESAFLIGLLASPDRRNPYTNFAEAKKAQSQVLGRMLNQRFITKSEAEEAKKEILTFSDKNTGIKAPHFVHFILEKLDSLGIKKDQGINVFTTLDYPAYSLGENIAKIWVAKLKDEHNLSNAALVLIKNDSGEIINLLGGIDYFNATHSGQVNMATALRQPGSALKPVTYAAAFMKGYTPASLIYDVKKVYTTRKGEGFKPNNYDGRFHGLILAREALASSFNLPAVEMLDRIGIGNFLKLAKDFGITTFTRESEYDLAITLGGGEVKLLELTNLFAGFARGGKYKEAYAIEKIVSDQGKLLYSHREKEGKQVLGRNGEEIAYLITHILSDPKARMFGFGEKNPLVLSRPAAVKTGTTTDWHDNWTVGYTKDYTVGVWVGNNDNRPMREITGVVGAAPIWNQFLEEFLKGKPVEYFLRPKRIKEVEICALSGDLPDEFCQERKYELFIEGSQPKAVSKLHKKVLIDKRNGLLTGSSCPQNFTESKIFIDYPPEVYSWALENHQEVIPKQFSPLCQAEMQLSGDLYLQIINPKEKAVFQTAPLLVSNERIVFEVNVSQNIQKVIWYLDGKKLTDQAEFPFSASWEPQPGKYSVKAVGFTESGKRTESQQISFSVVEFKDENGY